MFYSVGELVRTLINGRLYEGRVISIWKNATGGLVYYIRVNDVTVSRFQDNCWPAAIKQDIL